MGGKYRSAVVLTAAGVFSEDLLGVWLRIRQMLAGTPRHLEAFATAMPPLPVTSPLDPLQTLDAKGRVIYVGSFSKTMLPTLRLGFLVTPPSLRAALHKAKFVSDWHSSTLVQAALARFIDDGAFARHVRRMTAIYRERHEMLSDAVPRDFADHLELVPSTTGLHVSALSRRMSAHQIAAVTRRAAERGVAVQVLSSFALSADPPAGIMLGYGAITAVHIAEGLRLLRACFDE